MSTDTEPDSPTPVVAAAKPGAFLPALIALVLPLAAFALAWIIAGKVPMAVPKAEWGTWFVIGGLLGVAGIAGFAIGCKALMRGGYRSMAIAALVLNLVIVLIAWAGLFA